MRTLWHEVTGVGPVVVLLHPVGLDADFWGGLPDALSRTHTVVRADFVGSGRSSDSPRPGRMSSHVDDIVDLIAGLGRPATLLGVSFGGMVAQNVALARPDLIEGLVLCGCPGAIPAVAREAILQRGQDAEQGGMDAVIGSTLDRWFTPEFMSTDEVEHVRRRLEADTPSNWAATWESVSEHDALPRLGSLRTRALVVAGELDAATSVDAKRALAAAIPGSRLEIMPGAPHMMQIECEARFIDIVSGFLATLKGRPA